MADNVLFIGWDRARAGKEKEALEAFAASMSFWSEAVAKGQIESFEPVLLDLHGGDLNGFVLIRGSADKLASLRDSDEFRDLLVRADMSVSGIGVVPGFTGERLGRELARFQRQIAG
jgi:hypothetical protein